MHNNDTLQRFIFDNSHVRGLFIHLGSSYQTALKRYDYPEPVGRELGQALAASALLSATIKFKGSLIMQVQSGGPITMLVAQCNHQRHIRGLARWEGEPFLQESSNLYGEGRLTITIDNQGEERYQGIVSLTGGSLARAIENYFKQSEQLQTHLWLAADEQQAVGMLLQHLPGTEPDRDIWNRIESLGATLTGEEMLNLSTEEVLYRLFHEEQVRLFEAEPVCFRCSCSREKVADMLRALGSDEVNDIIREEGKVSVGCEFCNQQFEFDAVDAEELFAGTGPIPGSGVKH
jgi:molecular chaperone Hsp33